MANNMLLVEGKNDKHVFETIFQKYKVAETFDVENTECLDSLIKNIPISLKADITALGIVVDADADIGARWDSIRNILKQKGYDVPVQIPCDGAVIDCAGMPKVGVWIMPDNNTAGMLEDFVSLLIPADDLLITEVDCTLDGIEAKKLNKYKDVHKAKARIHTWLAWQEDPGTPMGLAITKTYLDINQQLCRSFVDWVNRLFN